jgi:hypothetical protein
MKIKNTGALVKDYIILKDREFFDKLFDQFTKDTIKQKEFCNKKNISSSFIKHVSSQSFNIKKSLIRELFYFKYKYEIPHYSNSFFSVPNYYGFNPKKILNLMIK